MTRRPVAGSKPPERVELMSDAEFEAYLKRNKITGMAAANKSIIRRNRMKGLRMKEMGDRCECGPVHRWDCRRGNR